LIGAWRFAGAACLADAFFLALRWAAGLPFVDLGPDLDDREAEDAFLDLGAAVFDFVLLEAGVFRTAVFLAPVFLAPVFLAPVFLAPVFRTALFLAPVFLAAFFGGSLGCAAFPLPLPRSAPVSREARFARSSIVATPRDSS
jgi:hypothetical protein